MNSPDDAFAARIDEAACSLPRRAPDGMIERIRERAADLGSSIETAARALAGPAPLDALDLRIAAAARELKRPAPRVRLPRTQGVRRIVLRSAVALAASIAAAALILPRLLRDEADDAPPALLTSAALARSLSDEALLDREAKLLQASVSGDAELVADETAQSLLEEVAFLDEAIDECRRALELSQAHAHLREQLLELTGRRVELLREAQAVGRSGGGAGGEARG